MELENLSKKNGGEVKETTRNNDQSSSSPSTQRNNLISTSRPVPNLNLNGLPKSSKSIKNLPKTTVRSHSELKEEVTKVKKLSHRPMLSDSSGQMNNSTLDTTAIDMNTASATGNIAHRRRVIAHDSDTPPLQDPINDTVIDLNNIPSRQKSLLPLALTSSDLITNLTEGKFYSTEEVWEFLKATNSTLHTFSIYNKLSLEEVVLYARLLDELNVRPEIVVEHIKKNINLDRKNKLYDWQKKAAAEKQVQKYKKIQEKDPDKYQAIVLDALKAIVSQEDGNNTPSPLNDTHIQMLEKQTASDAGTIRYQYVALAVSFIIWAGGFAWGIYGQIHGTATNAPTNAPTHMPTGAPI